MVFSSINFLFYFLPLVLIVYYIAPKKIKNAVLLIFSLLFYFYGEPKYTLLMIISIIYTYIFGILIDKYRKHSKAFLILFAIISLGFLTYFKYINFILQNINMLLKNKIDFINVLLPIGISFYTFQMISYIVDVYRKNAKAQKNIINLALYISLFPQLIAGPIVRYASIEQQLKEREHTVKKFSIGMSRFIIGLGKKVIIANVLAKLNDTFLVSNDLSILYFWMYGISNMLQIYFDFSGYSDMAIGLGRMFGFEFNENFNYPYISKSITEFWRRWHISLGSWFRDYVYIPLGGNRVSKVKWFRNILVVWLLTGLWHGAAWNFVIWGIYFGIILVIEKLFLGKLIEKMPNILKRIYVLLLVMVSFIIFSGNGVEQIVTNLTGLVNFEKYKFLSLESIYYFKSYILVLIIAIIGATQLPKKIITSNKIKKITNILEPIVLFAILMISTSYIIDGSFNPFLYFRF